MAELLSKLAAASRHAARIVGWRLAGRHDVGARCLAVVEALEGPHRVIADALRLGLAMHLTGATMVRVPEQPEDCLELLAGDDNVGYVMPITGPKVEKALEGPEPPLRVWMAVERLQRRCIAVAAGPPVCLY